MGAFGNRDEHDVHDADTADDEGNAGDDGENPRDNREERAGGVGDFVAREDDEVGVARFGGNEGFFDVGGNFGDGVGIFGADVDLLDLEGVVDFVEIGGGDEQGRVEVNVVEVDWVVDFGESADDDKALAEESDGFADGLGGAKELGGEFGANDGGRGLGIFTEKNAVFEA